MTDDAEIRRRARYRLVYDDHLANHIDPQDFQEMVDTDPAFARYVEERRRGGLPDEPPDRPSSGEPDDLPPSPPRKN